MSCAMRELPILDLHPIIHSNNIPEKTLEDAEKSLRSIGFFVVKNHGIDPELIQQTFGTSREFFDLPEAEKMKISMDANYPYGYERAEILSQSLTGEGTVPDHKETFNIPVFNARWPENPPRFQQLVKEYCDQMWNLTRHILKLFAAVLRQDDTYFNDKFPEDERSMTVARMLNYPHLEGDMIRCSEHTDYGVLTILATDKIGGLQVKLDGKDWEHVSTPSGCLVINIGDMMMRWSNDTWKSTLHRVVSIPDKTLTDNRRQSMAFFVQPGRDVMIECIPDYLKEGEEAKYPNVRAGDYILTKHYSTVPSLKSGTVQA